MFIGHYAAGLALKKVDKNISLGALFIAVQFVDILFFPFVLLGIERMTIIENYTPSTHFRLDYYPYTHSLLASATWALLVYAAVYFITRKNKLSALAMGLGVISHWFVDLIAHTPDLPLWGDASPKLGFGLWENAVATYVVEALMLLGGLWVYLKVTKPSNAIGKYGILVMTVFLLLANALNIFGPLNDTALAPHALLALFAYFVFAGMAWWIDKKRA